MSNVCELSFASPYDKTDKSAGFGSGIIHNSGNAARQESYNSPKLDSMIEEITKQILSGLKR